MNLSLLSLYSHHILVEGGDTCVLAAGYPDIRKAEGEESQEMEGQEPDIQHQKSQPVSPHHAVGSTQDSVRGQIRKVQQQIVAHGKGEIPEDKNRQADHCQPSDDRKGSSDGFQRCDIHVQLKREQTDKLPCSDEGTDADTCVRILKKTGQQIPDQDLLAIQKSQKY